MHIVKCITEFADQFFRQFLSNLPFGKQPFQITAVHPIHDDAVSQGRNVHHSVILAYVRVVEREAYVEVLLQKFFIKCVAPIFRFQGLVDKEPSVLVDLVEDIEPVLGIMDDFEVS